MSLLSACYPHISEVSDEKRPISVSAPPALSVPEEDLARHTPPGFVSEVLENGMRISVLSNFRSSFVSMRLFYNVGELHTDAPEMQIPHLLEHLLFTKTSTQGENALAHYVTRHGGQYGAFTELTLTKYSVSIATEYREPIFHFFAELMHHIDLNENLFQREKKIVIEENMLRVGSNPFVKLSNMAFQKSLGQHPLGRVASTSPEFIEKITMEQVLTFYQTFYGPQNAHLVIVGPVDPQAEITLAKKLFSTVPRRGQTPPVIESLLSATAPKEAEFSQDLLPGKASILLYPLPNGDSRDELVLKVIRHLLCHSKVQSSIAHENEAEAGVSRDAECTDTSNPLHVGLVKEKHASVYAGPVLIDNFGPYRVFVASAAYLPYRRKATAFSLLEKQVEAMNDFHWLSEKKLLSVKEQFSEVFYEDFLNPNAQAERLGSAWVTYGDPRYAFYLRTLIENVSIQDIKRVYTTYISKQIPTKVYLTPEKVPAWITLFGWLYPLVMKG